MLSVTKWEIKKNLRLGVFALWMLGLVLAYVVILPNQNVYDIYADIFSKYYGLTPIMGVIMFTMFSGSFVLEYNSNMDGLIKASKSGTKQLITSKFIANGICASIVNLSVFIVMLLKAVLNFGTEGLDLPLKNLWYFGNSGSNITVLQMILIVSITVILGSFLFAAIGLYLSSINEKATTPFIIGGIILGLPYLGILPQVIILNSPLYGMYSQQLIRYSAPISSWIIFVVIVFVLTTILYNLTKRSFAKEK
ncbi:MAG: hypothetical protein ACRC2K_10625 [Clostridium sp.]